MNKIVGRNPELELLDKLYRSGKPEFLAIYSRRGVGKTYLIHEFFKNEDFYFNLLGIKGASLRKQLLYFSEEFLSVFGPIEDYKVPENWFDAFQQLRDGIQRIKRNERIILFLDDLPWLTTPRSCFIENLNHFWDYMSKDNRVMLIVCGPSNSWIIKKVIHNKGMLHEQLTAKIRLLPFDLKEAEEYLHDRGVILDPKSIIDIYVALGGIPRYLNYVQKGQSAPHSLENLCFGGRLTDEFNQSYAALFDNYAHHIRIVKALALHPSGLTKNQIVHQTGLTVGGRMHDILEELEVSGFILAIKNIGKQKKEKLYRLVDKLSLFFLRWQTMAEKNNIGSDGLFWVTAFNSSLGQSSQPLFAIRSLLQVRSTI